MKGVVFDLLRDMVEDQFGLEGWNTVLEKAGSDGMYLSPESYSDQEMMSLVLATSDYTGINTDDLLRAFGQFMAKEFYNRFPSFFDNCDDLIEFLLSVDRIVHGEVLKFYPDANLPSFAYEEAEANKLTMIYRSDRMLCHLAEGLIQGSAAHYKKAINIDHDLCMHNGNDCCHIDITVLGGADE